MNPAAVDEPCLPPKSSDTAPDRYEYGPMSKKPTSETITTGQSLEPPKSCSASPTSAVVVRTRQTMMMSDLLVRPSQSLRTPASSTESPPKNGNRALWSAASPADIPSDSVK